MVPKTASKPAETEIFILDKSGSPYIAEPGMAKVLLPGRSGYTRFAHDSLDPQASEVPDSNVRQARLWRLNLGRHGRICVHEDDMKKTELGKKLLNHYRLGSGPEMNGQAEITGEGPDRDGTGTRLSLRVGAHGTIIVREESMKGTKLGRELLKRYRPHPSGIVWSQIKTWVYSQLVCLPNCGLS